MIDMDRLEKLITRVRYGGKSTTASIVSVKARQEIMESVEPLIDYWVVNHTDRRCSVCHGRGDTIEFLGMMEDLIYPMMKTEECTNCLGKGTVTS